MLAFPHPFLEVWEIRTDQWRRHVFGAVDQFGELDGRGVFDVEVDVVLFAVARGEDAIEVGADLPEVRHWWSMCAASKTFRRYLVAKTKWTCEAVAVVRPLR